LKKVASLKTEYVDITNNLLDTLEDRIEKGNVYDESAIFAHYTSEKEAIALKDKQKDILKKIAKIAHIFWTSKNYAGNMANVEGVNKYSNDIMNVLKVK